MTTTHDTGAAIESVEAFCRRLSERLSGDGVDVDIRPGDHLVDDAGADSLMVLEYVLLLQESGMDIDLNDFDEALLRSDVAYDVWLRTMAVPSRGAA